MEGQQILVDWKNVFLFDVSLRAGHVEACFHYLTESNKPNKKTKGIHIAIWDDALVGTLGQVFSNSANTKKFRIALSQDLVMAFISNRFYNLSFSTGDSPHDIDLSLLE
jgi:hypothetical protein